MKRHHNKVCPLVNCAAGSFSSATGAVSCTSCATGYKSFSGSTECDICADGYYWGLGGSNLTDDATDDDDDKQGYLSALSHIK